jgi:hypothetical protein
MLSDLIDAASDRQRGTTRRDRPPLQRGRPDDFPALLKGVCLSMNGSDVSRRVGVRAFFLIFCFLLSGIPVAQAEYHLRLIAIDEMGAQRALASWTCPIAGRAAGTECRQQVEMSLGGKAHLVEVQFIVDGGHTINLSLTANNYVLQAQRNSALYLDDGDGAVGGSYELWARQKEAEPYKGLYDLVFRPPYDLSTTIGLVVEKVTASGSK